MKFVACTRLRRFAVCLCSVLALWLVSGARPGGAVEAEQIPIPWDAGKQGAFVVSLAFDLQYNLWVGTEDKGVWRYTSGTRQWTQFTTKDGLGDDNAYAITTDRLGRVWVGTLNHGVSVFNGQQWRTYGLLDGPLGERVFAMTTSPVDGDVWIATNAGLSRYALKSNTWHYYTRRDGLPSDQANALAFDSTGNLYVGTQCDGLVIGTAENDYKSWKVIPGAQKMPLTVAGEGLPSNQINDVLVTDNDVIYVATPCGLARSHDFGEKWSFLRGVDWEAKVRGLRHKPEPQAPAENLNREILREDYVTNLAEDANGLLWIGYRVKGYEIRRPVPDRVPFVSAKQPNSQFPYVSTVLPLGDGTAVLANYGDGLARSVSVPEFVPTDQEREEWQQRRNWRHPEVNLPRTWPALPAPAPPPTVEQLKTLLAQFQSPSKPLVTGAGYYLGEEWRTQGDWVGRYGSRYAMLCASGAPLDHAVVNDLSYRVKGTMGPGFKGNSLRHWIHWMKSDNPRVLYNPLLGYRREAEWDDNGEVMSMAIEGPDVWTNVQVPAGVHKISLYFFNKDGHDGQNRMRDYLVELKAPCNTVNEAEAAPTIGRTRVRDFWGGVYKQFVVSGPGKFWIKVGRNNSFNTILNGVFVDKLSGPATKYEKRRDVWLAAKRYELDALAPLPLSNARDLLADPLVETASALWNSTPQSDSTRLDLSWQSKVMAFRAVATLGWPKLPSARLVALGSKPELQALLKRWRWQMAFWSEDDRAEFQENLKVEYQALLARQPALKTAKY